MQGSREDVGGRKRVLTCNEGIVLSWIKMILKKLFGFDPSVMKVRTEIMAGVTTFLTMSYILAVNPDILSAASMDRGAVFTATALAASLATLVMAILAKLPFALAPGMGLNAFFAFTPPYCHESGRSVWDILGRVPWQPFLSRD